MQKYNVVEAPNYEVIIKIQTCHKSMRLSSSSNKKNTVKSALTWNKIVKSKKK